MRQEFETEELKQELERSLGFALRTFERLDGASALNFKAVRASDGLAFAVKCSPVSRQELFDHLVEHLEEVRGTKAVRRLFARDCPAVFRGYNVICLSWCPGERLFPDQLSEAETRWFCDDYLDFSAALQKATGICPHDPIADWLKDFRGKCRGLAGLLMKRTLASLDPEACDYRPELLRIVHGDFHHGNFLFVDGRVAGYFDLEEFTEGYPTDDLVRYVVCAAEHLRWYEWRRRRRTIRFFAHIARNLPYTRHEWLVAINSRYIAKLFMKTGERPRVSLGQVINLAFRARLYDKMRRIALTASEPDCSPKDQERPGENSH